MRKRIQELKAKLKNQKGFTLIELMATLAILALIVAIAIPAVGGIIERAETDAGEANIAMIENAGQLAYLGKLVPAADQAAAELAVPGSLAPVPTEYTAKELVDGGFLNAELDATEEALVVTRQSNGTFTAPVAPVTP